MKASISAQSLLQFDDDLELSDKPQYFQICMNIIEANKLKWPNFRSMNSYVLVKYGSKRRKTSVRRSMEQPVYREYFVLEKFTSNRDMMMSNIQFSVLQPRCCATTRTIGEANLDLASVWMQPNHEMLQKWLTLCNPVTKSATATGYLKVDIWILCRGEESLRILSPLKDYTIEEESPIADQQRANYMITVYQCQNLPLSAECISLWPVKTKGIKLPSTFVRILFCGMMAKSSVKKYTRNPVFNEQISMVELFPNVNETIKFELCISDTTSTRVLANFHLSIADICHESENGFLPSFGPWPIHMYGNVCGQQTCLAENGPFYKGCMLLSIDTHVPFTQRGIRTIEVQPSSGFDIENNWNFLNYQILCVLTEISMIDLRSVSKTCALAITFGTYPFIEENKMGSNKTNAPEEDPKTKLSNMIFENKAFYTGRLQVFTDTSGNGYCDLSNGFPILQLVVKLPDYTYIIYRDNMFKTIISQSQTSVKFIEHKLEVSDYKSLREINAEINLSKSKLSSGIKSLINELNKVIKNKKNYIIDSQRKQLHLQMIDLGSILKDLSKRNYKLTNNGELQVEDEIDDLKKKDIRYKLAKTKEIIERIKTLYFKIPSGWPDIVLWLMNGNSRIAYIKIPSQEVLADVSNKHNGRKSGRFNTVFLKPVKCPLHLTSLMKNCHCFSAKVELCCWMGLTDQIPMLSTYLKQCQPKLYEGTHLPKSFVCNNSMMVECQAYIYRAKLCPGANDSGLANPYVSINAFNTAVQSQMQSSTLTPVWNEVTRLRKQIYCSKYKLEKEPSIALVEVLHRNSAKEKGSLIGRVQLPLIYNSGSSPASIPPLKWYKLQKGTDNVGQILMSLQVIEVTGSKVPEYLVMQMSYVTPSQVMPKDSLSTSQNSKAEIQDSSSKEITNKSMIETIPESLLPKTTSYKIDIYWWGLRDMKKKTKANVLMEMEDLTIKSNPVSDYKENSNFSNGIVSEVFEAPLQEQYSPPLSIKLYDRSTFGRTVFLGTNVLKNPKKFMIDWMSQSHRDRKVKNVRIHGFSFIPILKVMSPKASKPSNQLIKRKDSNVPVFSKVKKFFGRNKNVYYTSNLPTFFNINEKKAFKTSPKRKKRKVDYSEDHLKKSWWMRYFCSMENCAVDNFDQEEKIIIYNCELEKHPDFRKFQDWCYSLKMYKGKKTGLPEKDNKLHCGILKVGIAIYKWPPTKNVIAVSASGDRLDECYFKNFPKNEPTKYRLRLYVVEGKNLMPKDFNNKSDPYLIVKCGHKILGDRNKHIPNNLNPVFGRLFEIDVLLPDEYLMCIYVYDYNICGMDSLIGMTQIDFEDRIYTKYRATCGLPRKFSLGDKTGWRDTEMPSVILEGLCNKNHLPEVKYDNRTGAVIFNGNEYHGNVEGDVSITTKRETASLKILSNWHKFPVCGHHLVPEHVETRSLYHPDRPGIEQGKLVIFLDIFPLNNAPIPPPIDITPEQSQDFQVRVIIWQVKDIPLDDYNYVTKVRSSDIYVTAWIGDPVTSQSTDTHFGSTTGEGVFNWRMVYNVSYLFAQQKLTIKDSTLFKRSGALYAPPILNVQVLDKDLISQDDFLGSLSLNLSKMPVGDTSPMSCNLNTLERNRKINLFQTKQIRGWWPFKAMDLTGHNLYAGKVEMEIQILSKVAAHDEPVGLGRNSPQALPEPKREAFFDYSLLYQPWKLTRFLHKKISIRQSVLITSVVLLVLYLILTFIALPRIMLEKLIDRFI